MKKQIDVVPALVVGMLKENTGEHMLDSGGAYGRQWQRNQKVNFEKTPYLVIDSNEDGSVDSIDKNIYHFLCEQLKVTKESKALAKAWEKFLKLEDNKYSGYLTLMEEFMDAQNEDGAGYIGKGTQNTYNDPDGANLSQIIQFSYFSKKYPAKDGRMDVKDFILLQVHGGCDARGGYTKPQLFEVDLENFLCSFNVRGWCKVCGEDWENSYYVCENVTRKGEDEFACKKCGGVVSVN